MNRRGVCLLARPTAPHGPGSSKLQACILWEQTLCPLPRCPPGLPTQRTHPLEDVRKAASPRLRRTAPSPDHPWTFQFLLRHRPVPWRPCHAAGDMLNRG